MAKKGGHKKALWIVLLSAVLILALVFILYHAVYYHADETAKRYMQSDEKVTVRETGYGWLFDGPSEDTALIFYPGGKVEETAYAPLLHKLAEQGIDVCLVNLPLRIAFYKMNAAESVLKEHTYSKWYIGGHSLGGLIASAYAADHPDVFKGVILLSAYPMKAIPEPLSETLITGSNDRIVNWDSIGKWRSQSPSDYFEYSIEGGNHAQFGSYGVQKGDGTAKISAEEQVDEAVRIIVNRIR